MPAGQPLDRVEPLRVHRGQVELGRDLDAHLGHRAIGRGVIIFGRVEHRLGRDAADVEAGPAKRLAAFGAGGLEAQLRGADRGDIAAGPGADHQHVEIVISHRHLSSELPAVRVDGHVVDVARGWPAPAAIATPALSGAAFLDDRDDLRRSSRLIFSLAEIAFLDLVRRACAQILSATACGAPALVADLTQDETKFSWNLVLKLSSKPCLASPQAVEQPGRAEHAMIIVRIFAPFRLTSKDRSAAASGPRSLP